MNYTFNLELAIRYGLSEAIFLQNLKWWSEQNRRKGKNHCSAKVNVNGQDKLITATWVYTSVKKFSEVFPFWTERQIRYIIQKCEEKGLIYISSLSRDKRNHINWYAITEKIDREDNFATKRQKCKMDVTNLEDGIDKNVETIKDIKKYNIIYNNIINAEVPFEEIKSLFNFKCTRFNSIINISGKRKTQVLNNWLAHPSLEAFEEVFKKVQENPFFAGDNKYNWKASFDWIMKGNNMARILEGFFDRNKTNSFSKEEPSYNLEDYEKEDIFDELGKENT